MKKLLLATVLIATAATGAMAKHTAHFTGSSRITQHGRVCEYKTKNGGTYWFTFRGICADKQMV